MLTKVRSRPLFSLVLGVFAMLLIAGQTMALDVVTLKDGTRLEGEIVRETERFLEFKVVVGSVERNRIIAKLDIETIERDAETPDKEAEPKRPAPTQRQQEVSTPEVDPNATRVAFVTLGDPIQNDRDMVGTYINAGPLREIGDMFREMPEDERPEVIVLIITSGGGFTMEVPKLSEVIHDDLKRDFRVVAWIRSAISAAMMTAWNCEEIVMMPEGHIGGATQFTGGGVASKGIDLAEVLAVGELLSARGRHNPLIARAMQTPIDLSADIDEDGNVIWYEGLQGEHIVNTEDPRRILTLNSVDAVKYQVAIGIANTKEELAEVLGLRAWREVGEQGERRMREYRDHVWSAENRLNLAFDRYQRFVGLAQGTGDRSARGRFVGQARAQLSRMRGVVRQVPVLELIQGLNDEWFRQQERLLEDLMS